MFRSHLILLVALVFRAVGFSTPITYTINFNTTIYPPGQPSFQVAPTAGGFTYDASNTTRPFSDFTVIWDGTIFDLTNVANTLDTPGFGCDSQTTAPLLGTNIMFQTFVAPCLNVIYDWEGIYSANAGVESFTFFADNPACCTDEMYQVYPVAPGSGIELSGTGTWSVSAATPEPSTFGFLLAGLVVAIWASRHPRQTTGNVARN
jgi:hypothetical protein